MSILANSEVWVHAPRTIFENEVEQFEEDVMTEQEADQFLLFMEVPTARDQNESAADEYLTVPFSQKVQLLKKLKKYGFDKPEHRGNGLVRKAKDGYRVKISRLSQTQYEVIQRLGTEE